MLFTGQEEEEGITADTQTPNVEQRQHIWMQKLSSMGSGDW